MNDTELKIGDLVRIRNLGDYILDSRPPTGNVGIIVEIDNSDKDNPWFYVYIRNVGWKFRKTELEVVNA
jgi:hypothetical protein